MKLMDTTPKPWRVGHKVPVNVYAGDRPICQCHTVEDARHIVEAVNHLMECRKAEGKAAPIKD
jgi:hypothetical protein